MSDRTDLKAWSPVVGLAAVAFLVGALLMPSTTLATTGQFNEPICAGCGANVMNTGVIY